MPRTDPSSCYKNKQKGNKERVFSQLICTNTPSCNGLNQIISLANRLSLDYRLLSIFSRKLTKAVFVEIKWGIESIDDSIM
jgi:hypothetical protein